MIQQAFQSEPIDAIQNLRLWPKNYLKTPNKNLSKLLTAIALNMYGIPPSRPIYKSPYPCPITFFPLLSSGPAKLKYCLRFQKRKRLKKLVDGHSGEVEAQDAVRGTRKSDMVRQRSAWRTEWPLECSP